MAKKDSSKKGAKPDKAKTPAPKVNSKKGKKADDKSPKEEAKKDRKTIDSVSKGVKTFVDTMTGNKKPEVAKETTTAKQPEAILPVEETPKVMSETPQSEGITPVDETPKAEKKAKKSKYYSDVIHEIKSDLVVFLGIINAERGLKIHRVEEKKYLLSGMELDPNGINPPKPFEFIFPDELEDEPKATLAPNWFEVFQKELDDYEARLKAEAKAEKLRPKPKAGVDPAPEFNKQPDPVEYTTAGVEEMQAYGDLIFELMLKSPVLKTREFTPLEVENNLKKESIGLYKYELKFDSANRGWYMEVSQGNNIVRVPSDKTKFLPIK